MDSDPNTSPTSNDKPKCFRIANVRSNWSHDNLLNSLQTIDPSLKQMDTDEYQLSLYPSYYGSTQTALLNLRHCTENFRQLKLNDFNYPLASSGTELVIDSHFYDLTHLNSPRDEVVADVVAVTCLAGHAYGSWRSRTTHKMWLKHFLPDDVKNVKIMTYGYDSTLVGSENSATNLDDYKRNFIQQLGNARTAATSRPIIFLGHSLGGILILQGLRTDELEEMVDATTGGQRRNLIMQLKEGSDFMENQKEELIPIWNNFEQKVCSFYETVKTPSVRMIETERFARDGEVVQMVQRSSALLNLPYEDRIPATKNHTDIVKFATPADGLYLTVIKYMKECIGQTRRERIQQLLRSSKEVIYYYSIDQDRYLENLPMGCNFEHDGRYFWIFRNLDYQKWLELEEDVMVLVLRGSPILEHAAFEVFRTLQQEREASDLFLYFFFVSTAPGHSTRPQRPSKTADLQNLAIVCSLLKVAIDNHPQQQSLLETFLNEILELKDDTILDKLPANPKEAFTTLLCCATDQNLWDALGHVLRQAAPVDGSNTGSERQDVQRNKRNIALIVDLNNLELGRALISHITCSSPFTEAVPPRST
ncbi:hypothetical protein BDD12DRAFT_809527 [Trichophaea hybrida]|nr:hypothetical protein BDD12DRAFT_809527 [Trichophaea hybrida]